MPDNQKSLTSNERDALLKTLEERFKNNPQRHKGIEWKEIYEQLVNDTKKLWSLSEMERTGGEPDIIVLENKYHYCDCSLETPSGRRNLCYDQDALEARKKNKPQGSAIEMADTMGIKLLTEDQYRILQTLGEFDTKTSSWLKTPEAIRKRGGAIFGDRRYDHVFIYHNGADSYYAVRGFRGLLNL